MPYVLSFVRVEPGASDRMREWGRELQERENEVQLGLAREGVRFEAAFLLPTENGDLYGVFLDVDDPEAALEAFRSSPLPVDREHAEVMEQIGGGRERTNAELLYAFRARG